LKNTESEQPTRPVDLRDNGVEIDLPSREEIEGALKYLKQQGSWRGFYRGPAIENGGPNLVEALHYVIQQAFTSETLSRSWIEGILCP
jgi:hypothetical protein